jgi:hypothetical protein
MGTTYTVVELTGRTDLRDQPGREVVKTATQTLAWVTQVQTLSFRLPVDRFESRDSKPTDTKNLAEETLVCHVDGEDTISDLQCHNDALKSWHNLIVESVFMIKPCLLSGD